MDKKNKIAAIVIAVVVLICVSIILIKNMATSQNRIAVIYHDGDVIREINLDSLSEPLEFDLSYDGHTNRVRAEKGKIRMQSADCPDKICVNQGWIDSGAVPIVCLPHKITIEIKGGADEIDAAAGGM